MCFKLRPATYSDCELLWKWRNEITDKKNSFNSNAIPYDNHVQWFNLNFKNPSNLFFIMEHEEVSVGQLRLEINEFREGEIHITVDKHYRSMGIASKALFALEESIKESNINFLVAHVKSTNIASVILFIKSGFLFSRLVDFKGFSCYELKKNLL